MLQEWENVAKGGAENSNCSYESETTSSAYKQGLRKSSVKSFCISISHSGVLSRMFPQPRNMFGLIE